MVVGLSYGSGGDGGGEGISINIAVEPYIVNRSQHGDRMLRNARPPRHVAMKGARVHGGGERGSILRLTPDP